MVVLLIGILISTRLSGSARGNGSQVIAAFTGTAVSGALMFVLKREIGLELIRSSGAALSGLTSRLRR
jgi:hypothetical protein